MGLTKDKERKCKYLVGRIQYFSVTLSETQNIEI